MQSASFYNRFSALYPLADLFLKGQKKALIAAVNESGAGDILDVGVGTGAHLPRYKAARITGIDLSEGMLKAARRYQSDRIRLLLMNGEKMEFADGAFDAVVMAHVLAVAADPDAVLREAHRVLRPGGRLFILNHFTPENWLRYADWLVQPLARILRLRSVFRLADLNGLSTFSLLSNRPLGRFSYYRLLIFTRP